MRLDLMFALLTAALIAQPATATTAQDTEMPGVTATLVNARQYDGALHVGILLHNASDHEVSAGKALRFADVVLIDKKANRKRFALKDANGHYLAGPVSDWNEGGRWFPKLAPQSDMFMWVLFDAVASGSVVALQSPLLQPIEEIAPTEGPPATGATVGSSAPPITASVVSATRGEGQLKVRLAITNPGPLKVASRTIAYRDVYALDPQGKRAYPLLKDSDGLYIALPRSDKNEGGRWFLSSVAPNGRSFMDLTFQAPPDNVKTIDVIVPWFAPFEAIAISGEGGATVGGVAVSGKSVELERALKELNADVTPEQIKVNLSADLLFDFDKAEIKPAAEPQLAKVATVLKSFPNARVAIDGHADGKGDDAYNQKLSERRAQTVAQWLIKSSGMNSANVGTRGFGKSKPIAPNTKPDGSDDPEGRAKNRRVEIVVTK